MSYEPANVTKDTSVHDQIRSLEAQLAQSQRPGTFCAFCSQWFDVDRDQHLIVEHVKACPKHPMREVEQQLAQVTRERETDEQLLEEIYEAFDGESFAGDKTGAARKVLSAPEVIRRLKQERDRLAAENEALMSQNGPDAGFWGRACARLIKRHDTMKDDIAALRQEVEALKQGKGCLY